MKNININGQSNRLQAYEDGIVLFELRQYTITFKFLGNYYTSSNRKKPYSLRQLTWRTAKHQGFFYKLKLILTNRVHKMPKPIKGN